ncbi:MAG: helix-turn-helix transcriptional regulator [Clostridia bacterium]|nr:helix-turn-helix transcriptional regulator [Clostridia bacterium]
MDKTRYRVMIKFPTTPLLLNVLNIYQLGETACSSDYEVLPHRQWCHEITYIADGEGVFQRNGQEYAVSAGQVVALSQDDMHYIRSSRTRPLRFINLGFAFNKNHADYPKFAAIAEFFDNLEHPVANDLCGINEALAAALSEAYTPQELSQEMLSTYLLQVLMGTYRSFRESPRVEYTDLLTFDSTNPLIYEMICYIDQNLTSITALQEMGQALGYSYSYLSRLFSSTMGSTLRQYYNQRRFEKAVELLREPRTLADISEQLGFADTANFCRAFKKQYKISPGEYRRRNQ